MKIKLFIATLVLAITLVGCTAANQPDAIVKQNQDKMDQATRVMEQTKVPTISQSLERENIRKRLIVSNDPNTLQWIYPMSAGRVIGRFPVKGKVTSGGKRLTSSQVTVRQEGDSGWHEAFAEAPDEMGTYGSSGDYIFWFDPADRIHQHKGDYFLSPVPYKIDLGSGTISVETDVTEQSKVENYNKQIKESNKTQPTPEPTKAPTVADSNGGK